jgi:VWFA-related protein
LSLLISFSFFLTLALAYSSAPFQTQTPFRSGVDLIRLDVSVVDASGQPIRDLRPEDFLVKVDGEARSVSFARFYGPDGGASGAEAGAKPAPVQASTSFASNIGAAPGRVVVIFIDLESMMAGYEKIFLDTASQLVDRLGPSDAVGLLVLPGKSVDLTRDHQQVRQALQQLRGFRTYGAGRHVITIAEAEAYARQDKMTMDSVIERECRRGETVCPPELVAEARNILTQADRRIGTMLSSLAVLNTNLQKIEGPKSIVLLSAGLPFRQSSVSYFRELERGAAEAGTNLYVVHLEQPENDASRRTAGGNLLPRSDMVDGLSNVAGYGAGAFFNGVGTAAGVFDNIYTQVVHSYQLGVDSTAKDGDGKMHKVEVQVRRSGAVARVGRDRFIWTSGRAAMNPVAVLEQPTDLAETPMAAAAYCARGDEASTLKVVVLLELLGQVAAATTPAPGYAMTITREGETVFHTSDPLTVDASGARSVVGVQLAPGRYRMRAAAVDDLGRGGSVELPLVVGLRQAGPFQFSDLILGESSDPFTPRTHVSLPASIRGIIELYTTDPTQFDGLAVNLELRRSTEEKPIARAKSVLAKSNLERRQVADGQLPAVEEAGSYVVSAVIEQGGKAIGRISRSVVVRPRTGQ